MPLSERAALAGWLAALSILVASGKTTSYFLKECNFSTVVQYVTNLQLCLPGSMPHWANVCEQDLYLLYIDFSSAFNTIDHDKLLCITRDLRFPKMQYKWCRTRKQMLNHRYDYHRWRRSKNRQRQHTRGHALTLSVHLPQTTPEVAAVEERGYRYGCLQGNRNKKDHSTSALAYEDDLAAITSSLEDLDCRPGR